MSHTTTPAGPTTSTRTSAPPPCPASAAAAGTVSFRITLRDGSVERVDGADAYQQEQSMTTFFRTEGRQTVDCWSVRMASFRTDQILAVRRVDASAAELTDHAGIAA